MKSNHEANDAVIPLTSQLGDSAPIIQLKGECDRLRQRVLELEAQRERDNHRLVELENERDCYRAEACAWARQELERKGTLDEEELRRRIERHDGLPLEAFLGDLQRAAEGS